MDERVPDSAPEPANQPSPEFSDPERLDSLRELAESAARVGGEIARASFGDKLEVSLKADRSEVTDIDIAAERAIVEHIRVKRPGDTFIGEEGAGLASPQSAIANPQSSIVDPQSLCWIIDPIDGTRNYIRGAPFFACSVAAMHEGRPLVGAIYAPMFDVMYSAARGRGFLIDGRPSSLESTRPPNPYGPEARLLVGIPSARRPATRRFALQVVEKHVVRNYGAAALHLALVAAGQLDIAVAGNCKLWDIAAGMLLVEEAGGLVTSPSGVPLPPIDCESYAGEDIPFLAGASATHARLLRECEPA